MVDTAGGRRVPMTSVAYHHRLLPLVHAAVPGWATAAAGCWPRKATVSDARQFGASTDADKERYIIDPWMQGAVLHIIWSADCYGSP